MPCVLVVDDDDELREALVEAISDAGYAVEEARNGRVALEKMRRDSPCLVFLDLMMPVMTGWEVVAEMSADPVLARVPVCIITAQEQIPPPQTGCLIKKPVTSASLLTKVDEHCGTHA